MLLKINLRWISLGVLGMLFANFAGAQDAKTTNVELADGKIALVAPSDWVQVKPNQTSFSTNSLPKA